MHPSAQSGLGWPSVRFTEEYRLHKAGCTTVIPCSPWLWNLFTCKRRVKCFRMSTRKKTQYFEQVLLIMVNKKATTKVLHITLQSFGMVFTPSRRCICKEAWVFEGSTPQLAQPGMQPMCLPALQLGMSSTVPEQKHLLQSGHLWPVAVLV